MILTTVNLKGGLYRTTATLLLAQAYQQLGYDVAVLDLTPTDDCATLAKVLEDSGHPVTFKIDALPIPLENRSASADIKQRIDALCSELGDNGVLLVDTASHDAQIVEDVAGLTDVTFVPTDASFAAERPTLETIKRTTSPSVALVSPWQTSVTEDVLEATAHAGGKVLNTAIRCTDEFPEDYDALMSQYLDLAKELVAA
jgi:cellulose biosynthesis protein BcsQ